MKYVVLLLVLLVVIGIVRSMQRRGHGDAPRKAPPPKAKQVPGPQPMVACAQCGMHLPEHEAVAGRGGLFCGEPHRLQFERAHPEA